MISYRKNKKTIIKKIQQINKNKDLNDAQRHIVIKDFLNNYYLENQDEIDCNSLVKRYNRITAYSDGAYNLSLNLVCGVLGSCIYSLSSETESKSPITFVIGTIVIMLVLCFFMKALMLLYKDKYENQLDDYEAKIINNILMEREKKYKEIINKPQKTKVKKIKKVNILR